MAAKIILNEGREKSLTMRHPWIFSKAVKSISGRANVGDTVDVMSSRGKWLARAAYSPESQIRARVWTFNQGESVDHVFFINRLQKAQARKALLGIPSNAYRLIAGESDELPGVTIDVFDHVVVMQLLSAGAEKQREKIISAIERVFPEAAIYERSDVNVREKEGLEQKTGVVKGDVPNEVIIQEHGLSLTVDVKKGHKTGFYLDQRDSREVAKRLASNKDVLNCFSYTCTFACAALAGGATHVTNIDVSEDALARGKENLLRNYFKDTQFTQQKADVFNALRDYHANGEQFDMVILDPPKFVDSKSTLNRAARGYKDINMYAMHVVREGGLLLTFTCSGLMPTDLFQKIIADAALDAGKDVRFIQRLGQATDHSVLATYPQGEYLRGFVCQVSNR
ncbi:methyltransferase domain-containing protein [Alteromonas sediminis]|uniref:Methyltransferase domain-containing protein n=1 Tax=Alteromonas sediminis TaxID=2259342 RepID=A0A3N5Y2L8_9ALTE|nr:class I SAM-dependent methyltransferase [Alteromonas sediminis]RPJ67283.1 methyltransferase domain-containing protein [Alteromonas sediminis]